MNEPKHHLQPVVEVIYPTDPAAFREVYGPDNTAAPEYRGAGVRAMTDEELANFARTLQLAAIRAPQKIDELWSICCTLGYRTSLRDSA